MSSDGSTLFMDPDERDTDPVPDPDEDLKRMSRVELLAAAQKLRQAIRSHRDSSGHDLCWYWPEMWSLLPDKADPKPRVPPRDEFLYCCARYRDSLEGVDANGTIDDAPR